MLMLMPMLMLVFGDCKLMTEIQWKLRYLTKPSPLHLL
jgi:hypothetical protein